MKMTGIWLLGVLLAATLAGQVHHVAKRNLVNAPTIGFICPDAEAKQACMSYRELLDAKDSGLIDELDDTYVCFRKSTDEFFVIAYSNPTFGKVWNPNLKRMVLDSTKRPEGSGYAESYKDGIEDSTVMPSIFFAGFWIPYPQPGGVFVSDEINFEKQKPGQASNVSVSQSQVYLQYEYQNISNEPMEYNLTIQRSTRRYSEHFQEKAKQIPILENTSRCVYHKASLD